MKSKGVSFRNTVKLLRANHAPLATPGPIVRKGTTAAVKLFAPFKPDVDGQSGAAIRQALSKELYESGRISIVEKGESRTALKLHPQMSTAEIRPLSNIRRYHAY